MISLLALEEGEKHGYKRMPDYYADLNLDQIVAKMQERNKEYDLKPLFYGYPKNKGEVLYRQEIFRDIEERTGTGCLYAFSGAMRRTRKCLEKWEKTEHEQQKSVCYLAAVKEYFNGIYGLLENLVAAEPASAGLKGVLSWLEAFVREKKMQECRETAEDLSRRLSELSFHLTLTEKQMTIATGKKEVAFFDKLRVLFPEQFEKQEEGKFPEKYYMTSPFLSDGRLGYLESEAVAVYKKMKPDFFRDAEKFANEYRGIISEEPYGLELELQFYLSFLAYRGEMQKHGCVFCMPRISEDGTFRVTDGYDIALAWKNMWMDAGTVANSVEYRENERFFVVTGPNQGGKTTFARSLGQLVFFAMQGLPVAAAAAELPFFDGLMTHFSAEESAQSGRGKLKEELIRLGPMMKEKRKNQFVILNELFTTAATYDAHVMGSRVLRHFIAQDCIGVYVTHISELTEGIEGVVSLVAVADGENHRHRTFRLDRRPAEGTGYAADIVERHRLTYEDLTKRLTKRLEEAAAAETEVTAE